MYELEPINVLTEFFKPITYPFWFLFKKKNVFHPTIHKQMCSKRLIYIFMIGRKYFSYASYCAYNMAEIVKYVLLCVSMIRSLLCIYLFKSYMNFSLFKDDSIISGIVNFGKS